MDDGTPRDKWEEVALGDSTQGEMWHSGAGSFPLMLAITGIGALVSWLISHLRRRTSPDR